MHHSQKTFSWSWLYYALAMGLMLSWYWVGGGRLDAFLSGDWVAHYLIPGTVACLLLIPGGAFLDRRDWRGRCAVVLGGGLLLLLLFGRLVSMSEPWLAPMATVLFIMANAAHLASLPQHDPSGQLMLPARGLAMVLGVLLIVWFCESILQWHLPWLPILLVPAAVLLVLFALNVWEPARVVNQENLRLGETLIRFSQEVGSFSDVRNLLLFLFLFAAATAQLQFTVWTSLAEGTFPISVPTLPLVFLGLVAVGAASTGSVIRAYGNRRGLMVASLLAAIMVPGLHYSDSNLEISLMVLFVGLLVGLVYGSGMTLVGRMVPIRVAGMMGALAFCALVGGIGLGKILQIVNRQGAVPWINMATYLAALGIIMSTAPGRAVRFLRPDDTLAEDLDPRDVDWTWLESPPTGAARHNGLTAAVQFVARALVEIFFGRLRVVGREHLKAVNGAILVANHPNTFFDPLLVTAIAPGKLHYWAKSTLWKLPLIGAVLDRLGAMPVYRRQDGESKGGSGNQRSLELAASRLNEGAHVLIFPEGVSQAGLCLKPLKTGAARLGLLAMERRHWQEDVPLIPIGLDYDEPSIFRGGVTIRIGEPIAISTYREAVEANERQAVRQITEDLTNQLKDLLPHLDAPELERLVVGIQELYGEQILQILGESDETSARKAIVNAVNHYQQLDPDTLYLFNERVMAYQTERERLATPENHEPLRFAELLKILASLFSLTSFGLVSNWVPYRLTGRVVEWTGAQTVWLATAKLVIGGLLFGIYYTLVGILCYSFLGGLLSSLILMAMAFSAFIALGAMDRYAFRFQQLKTLWQAFWTQDTNDELDAMKVSLIQDLDRFRETYEFYMQQRED